VPARSSGRGVRAEVSYFFFDAFFAAFLVDFFAAFFAAFFFAAITNHLLSFWD
jgi:hypothetical protein